MEQNDRPDETIITNTLTIYKRLVSLHLYNLFKYNDKSGNINFELKLERVRSNTSLANCMCYIQGINRDSLCRTRPTIILKNI